MANHASHGRLPYPIRNARFTVLIPYLDADGDPTDPTTPDTEISKDDGAAADTAEEVATPKNSIGMLTLTGAETDCSLIGLAAKAASGPKTTLFALYPRDLPVLESGTAQAGASTSITLASGAAAFDLTGCYVRTTGGTGGGGTGGANNQARRITAYNTSTKVATVAPAWEVTVDNTTTYDILCPEGVTPGMLKALNPTTPGRALTVEADGMAHADVKEVEGVDATNQIRDSVVDDATRLDGSALNGLDAKIGTPAAASVSADILVIDNFVDELETRLTAGRAAALDEVTAARMSELDAGTGGKMAAEVDIIKADLATVLAAVVTEVADILAAVDTEVAAIKAKTDLLTFSGSNLHARIEALANDVITAAAIAAGAITAPKIDADAITAAKVAADVGTEIANAILDLANGVETGVTLRQAQRLSLAALAGKLSGAATTTIAIRDVNDTKTRITGTVDADGNRTAVIYDTT